MTFTFDDIKKQNNNGIIVVEVGNSIEVKSVTNGFYKALGCNANDKPTNVFDLVYCDDRDMLIKSFIYAAENSIANDCIFRAGHDGYLLEHMCFFRYLIKKNNNAVVIGAVTNITNISSINSLKNKVINLDRDGIFSTENLNNIKKFISGGSHVIKDVFDINKNICILIVTDDDSSLIAISKALKNEYELDYVDSYTKAFEKMNKKSYSMVICDIFNSESNYCSFLKKIRDDVKLFATPIILLVESKKYDTELEALKLGATDVIQKSHISEILYIKVSNLVSIRENVKLSEQKLVYEMQLWQQSRLLWLAEHDELTGLLNRQAFYRQIRIRLDKNPHKKYMIIRFDIDKFSVLNDTMGVKCGDKLLKGIADVIREICADKDIVYARIDADHFAILSDVMDIAPEYIFSAIEKQSKKSVSDYSINLHMGVYIIDDYSLEPSIMCDRALMVLKSLKGSYTNRIAYYDDSIRSQLLTEQELVADMDDALKNNEFMVYFQPQYNYLKGKLLGAEALVRWKHPKHGMMSPDSFIPLFERNGFITKLDEFVWEEVCRYISKQIEKNGSNVAPVSVNVSRTDIYRNNFCDVLCAITDKYNVPHSLLHLEITESSFMKNSKLLIKIVGKLKELGFTIEMDDFGSSFSSLNILKDVPVDVLKLDMKFLSDTDNTARSGNILSSVIRMARWLTIPVIAEGVETKEQADYLKSIGCFYMQGYYFSKPMPLKEYKKLVDINNIGGLDKYKSVNIKTAERFWDASAQTALIFNTFIGGAVIVERYGSYVEILRANDEFFDAIDMQREKSMTYMTNFAEYLDKQEKSKFLKMLDIASEQHIEASCVLHFMSTNGKVIWTSNRTKLLAHNINSDIFYISIDNITEIKQKESELLEKVQVIDKMQSVLPYGVVEYIIDDNSIKILSCNDAAWKMMNFRNKEDFVNTVYNNYTSGKAINFFNVSKDKIKSALKKSEIIDFESNIRSADGYMHRFRVYMQVSDNKPSGILFRSSFIDINDIIQNIPIGFAIYQEKERFQPIFIDKKVCDMFQIDDIDENYLPDFSSISDYEINQLHTGKTVTIPRLHVKRADNTSFWIRMVCTLVKKNNASPLCYITMFDVSDEVEKEQNALLQESKYKVLIESTKTITFDYSIDRNLMTVSFATPGKNRRQVNYNNYTKYLNEDSCHIGYEFRVKIKDIIDKAIIKHREYHDGVIDYQADYYHDGYRWYRAKYISLPDTEGKIKNIIGRIEDVNDIMTSQIDMVTDLLNKDAARIAVERIIKEKPADRFDAMLFIDIDNFKSVNDTIGHLAADKLLRKIANAIKDTFKSDDIVARYGGDEFLIYIVSAIDMNKTAEKANELINNVSMIETKVPNGVHCSVGITAVYGEMKNFEALFNRTDYALYTSKHDGKGRYTISSSYDQKDDTGFFFDNNKNIDTADNNPGIDHGSIIAHDDK